MRAEASHRPMPMNLNRERQLQIVTRLSHGARAAVCHDRWWRRAKHGRARVLALSTVPREREAILASLHAAVVARPHDLRARFVYAEALQPEDPARSAFILHQLAARLPGDNHMKTSWAIMEEQVPYTAAGRTWQDTRRVGWERPFRELDVYCDFNRGFVESVTLAASRFVELAAKIAIMAPIRALKLSGDCHNILPAVLEQPMLRQIQTLKIEDKLLDKHLQAIAAAPFLRGLKGLYVGPLLAGHQGLRALAGMPTLTSFAVSGPGDPLIAYEHDPENFDCMTPDRTVRSTLNKTLEAEFGSLPWLFTCVR